MNARDLLARAKAVYGRGSMYIAIINNVVLLVIALKVFYEPISSFGLPMHLLYLGAAPFLIFVSMLVGVIDLKWGVWREENNTAWLYTPLAMDHVRKTDEMYEAFKCSRQK